MIISCISFSQSIRSLLAQLAVLLLVAGSISSCSNEIEAIGVWRDIPVVYGVLNWEDSVHYIRIERAFLPPNRSALEVAREVDSIYFDPNEFNVRLYRIVNSDTIPWPNVIERVNLADEGIFREDGLFQNEPSYAYKTTGKTANDLLLEMEYLKTGNTFYARTESVNADNSSLFLTPRYSKVPFNPIKFRDVNDDGDEVYAQLTMTITNSYASIYDYKFRFYYHEFMVDAQGVEIPGTRKDTSIWWRAVTDYIPESRQVKQSVSGESFYLFLARALSPVTGTNIRRCPGYLEVIAVGGSSSIRDYILARKANEGFVGGLYPSEPYSNVGKGYGVLGTSETVERKDRPSDPRLMELSGLTLEHLQRGDLTKELGFTNVPCY